MRFVHEDPDFPALLDAVAVDGPLASAAMVEKDYWICHALWALRCSGIEFWFKGGTSLSKAFGIVQRFSEDLDLIVLPGRLELPKATSWKTETAGAIRSREVFWRALLDRIEIPGARLEWDNEHDPSQRNAGFRVVYPGHLVEQFRGAGSVIKPFVLLEISHGSVARSARVPSVERSISSTVHDWLVREGRMDAFLDNRPVAVESVHPYVTLLESSMPLLGATAGRTTPSTPAQSPATTKMRRASSEMKPLCRRSRAASPTLRAGCSTGVNSVGLSRLKRRRSR